MCYKCDAIIVELHRAKKIASNFDIKIKDVVNKYIAAGFPTKFVCSIINNSRNGKVDLIRPQWLFEERKAVTICLPFSPSNESFEETFISKLIYFTNENAHFMLFGTQRKCSHYFDLKDKVDHYSFGHLQGRLFL